MISATVPSGKVNLWEGEADCESFWLTKQLWLKNHRLSVDGSVNVFIDNSCILTPYALRGGDCKDPTLTSDILDSPLGALHVALALAARGAGALGEDAVAGLEQVVEVPVAAVRPLIRNYVSIAIGGLLRSGGGQAQEGDEENLEAKKTGSPYHTRALASHPACDTCTPPTIARRERESRLSLEPAHPAAPRNFASPPPSTERITQMVFHCGIERHFPLHVITKANFTRTK